MINNTTVQIQHSTNGNLDTVYPINFQGATDNNGSPMLRVVVTGSNISEPKQLVYNVDYELVYNTMDPSSLNGIKLLSLDDAEEGNILTITRNTPFEQNIDFQIGRIDPEQIEEAADLSVLRDQELRQSIDDVVVENDNQTQRIANIEAVIPSDTSPSNKLTNKSYVDGQVTTVATIANNAMSVAGNAVTTADNAFANASYALSVANYASTKSEDAADYAQQAMDMVVSMSSDRYTFTIASGQTTLVFDEDISDKQVDLYWNGVLITQTGSWSVSTNTITMLFSPDVGDIIVVFVNKVRHVVNAGDLLAHNTSPNAHQNLFNNIDCGVM